MMFSPAGTKTRDMLATSASVTDSGRPAKRGLGLTACTMSAVVAASLGTTGTSAASASTAIAARFFFGPAGLGRSAPFASEVGARPPRARVRGRADAFHAVVAIVAPTSGGASRNDVVAAHALGVREARLRAAHGERLGAIGPRGREREEGRREGAARATREDGNGPRGVALTKETPGAAGDEATRSSIFALVYLAGANRAGLSDLQSTSTSW